MLEFRTSPEMTLRVEAAEEVLSALPLGGLATWSDLRDATSCHELEALYVVVRKARKGLEGRTSARFATVKGVGVRRLKTDELPGLGALARQKIGRTARRGFQALTGIAANDIDRDLRARLDAERSTLGAIAALASERAVRKAEEGQKTAPAIPALDGNGG